MKKYFFVYNIMSSSNLYTPGTKSWQQLNCSSMTCNDMIINNFVLESPVQDNTENRLVVLDTATNALEYRDVASLPVVNPFDQDLNTTDSPIFNGLNLTNQLDMGVNNIVNVTGLQFVSLTNDNAENRLVVLDTATNELEYRNVASLPVVNPFDQDLNTTDNVQFNNVIVNQLDSGITSASLLDVDTITFAVTPTNDNTENRLLVLNTADDTIEYRDVASLPVVNPFDQDLNTTDSPTFDGMTLDGNLVMNANDITGLNSLETSSLTSPGSGITVFKDLQMLDNDILDVGTFRFQTVPANDDTEQRVLVLNTADNVIEYRTFDQSVNINESPIFGTLTLTGIVGDNTQAKLLVLDGITNQIEYRTVASLPASFNQAYAESTTLSTSIDTVNWLTKVSIPSTAFPAGDYLVSYSCIMSNSNRENATGVRLLQDGVNVSAHNIYHARPPVNNYLVPVNQFYKRTLTAANHTFDLQMRPEATTGAIAEARIIVYRID